jgi:radical SAM superfamily enzyme with C-terminal helix-hairpin-helix motif
MYRTLYTNQMKVILTALAATVFLAACGTPATTGVNPTQTSSAAVEAAATTDTAVAVKLNLNTATADEFLAAIPGLPSRMTREFDEYRPYVSIQQFRREIGKYVDDATVASYEQYVYVPIAVNDSDSDTLQQIPGLDAAEADNLMAGRPYAANDDFLASLAKYVSETELATAKLYLAAQ